MIRNHPDVQAWLDAGKTLVVPSRQRAAAVRLAHAASHYEGGQQLWDSPDVLPWSAWLAREQPRLADAGQSSHRQLTGVEDWLLWRGAVRYAGRHLELLNVDSLLEPIRRSSALLDDWGISLTQAPTTEAELLLLARRNYQERCRALPAALASAWLAGDAPLARPTWLLGFPQLGAARRRALLARGALLGWQRATGADNASGKAAVTRSVAAQHPDAEYELMAAWCREHLQRDAGARLLLVVPNLGQHGPRLRRALTEALTSIGLNGDDAEWPAFATEGGVPLLQYELVAAALALLRLCTGWQSFQQCSALLRSPYLGFGGWQWRARFERWLREQNVTELDWRLWQQLRGACRFKAAGSDLEALDQLLQQSPSGNASAADWARQFALWLEAAGWPGEAPLGSAEQQVRLRFEQVLGEMATAAEVAGALRAAEACQLLDEWLQQTQFEVASGDVPVTVTSSIDDPVVRYDGIWVAGLSAETWPLAATGDAFVPFSMLARAELTTLSAAGQQQRARAAMQAWEAAAEHVVYSWPARVDDAELTASPLLPTSLTVLEPWRAGLLTLAVATEACGPDEATPWLAARHARGGVRLIQAQSQCPFKASAIGRLQCEPLGVPEDGISPPMHGQIVHRALESIWQQLRHSAALQSAAMLPAMVQQQVARAVAERRRSALAPVPEAIWQIEAQRCEQIILRLMQLEAQRAPFAVQDTEASLELLVGGLPLSLRRDRIDRLDDATAHTIIIDYKTGRPVSRPDWLAERPTETQLLCYALGAGDELCAIASLHVNAQVVAFKGVSDVAGRLPGVVPVENIGWQELRAHWTRRMHQLGADFVAGHAGVEPLPDACAHCHLKLLCRVHADELVAAATADGSDTGANDD